MSVYVYNEQRYNILKFEVEGAKFYEVHQVAKGATYYSQGSFTKADIG